MAKNILKVPGFDIIKRIGTGARSTIYLAIDEHTEKEVALKRVVYEKPQDARIFEQCEVEFKVAQKIEHPYVRKCYKLRKTRNMFKTRELIVSMEYLAGRTLEQSPTLSLVDVLLKCDAPDGLHTLRCQAEQHTHKQIRADKNHRPRTELQERNDKTAYPGNAGLYRAGTGQEKAVEPEDRRV